MSAKESAFQVLRSLGVFSISRRLSRGAVRILCYHGAWLGSEGFSGDTLFITAAAFDRQLDAILQLGYPVLPLAEVVERLRHSKSLPPDCTVLTIDDGWSGTYRIMAPALKRRGLPATLYVDTNSLLSGLPVPHVMARYLVKLADAGFGKWPSEPARRDTVRRRLQILLDQRDRPASERMEAVREIARGLSIDIEPYLQARVFQYMTPEELADIGGYGVDVQLHTHNHTMHDFSAESIRREIGENRRALSGIVGRPPETFRHFCYPSGRHTPGCAETLAGTGILSATTTTNGLFRPGADPFLMPRILSGAQVSPLVLEAELCGFGTRLRKLRRPSSTAAQPRTHSPSG
jgi:peptidoglycan/xylan/chitin deacetylase (PgdA/CDA1 family)